MEGVVIGSLRYWRGAHIFQEKPAIGSDPQTGIETDLLAHAGSFHGGHIRGPPSGDVQATVAYLEDPVTSSRLRCRIRRENALTSLPTHEAPGEGDQRVVIRLTIPVDVVERLQRPAGLRGLASRGGETADGDGEGCQAEYRAGCTRPGGAGHSLAAAMEGDQDLVCLWQGGGSNREVLELS